MNHFNDFPFNMPEQHKRLSYSPKDVYDALRKRGIVGQDTACRAASLITYNSMNGRPSVNIYCGATGCGKTAIWQALRDELGAYVGIYDASGITAEGWKGGSILTVLVSHLRELVENGYSTDDKLHGILVLDEFDKIIEPQYGSSGTNHSALLQGQLLRLFDHATVTIADGNSNKDKDTNSIILDCSQLTIICCGAFERLLSEKTARQERPMLGIGRSISRPEKLNYSNTTITADDLITFGMRSELVGRIDRIVQLQPLSIDDMTGIVRQEIKKLSCAMHSTLDVNDNAIHALAQDALDRGLGARWIRSRLAVSLDEQVFKNPDAYQYQIRYATNTE